MVQFIILIILFIAWFIILFMQIIHKNIQIQKKNKDNILKLPSQYLERFSSSVQKLAYRAGIERTSKKSY